MKVCIVGASGKLGQYMVQHSLDRGHEVVGVCRPASVAKLDARSTGERLKGCTTEVPTSASVRPIIAAKITKTFS